MKFLFVHQNFPGQFLHIVRHLVEMGTHEIVFITEDLYQQALALFCSRLDKEWGLIDCVSFIVMQERGLTNALTADEHFEQAGFRALLRFE